MEATGYYIFYALNWLITLLPLRILYIFSDILFIFLYWFPGYRRKVVDENLRNAFPEKSEKERAVIARKFYSHLCDMFIETFKLPNMSRKEALKRFRIENPEVLQGLFEKKKDVIAVIGHYNNWEIMNSLPLQSDYTFVSIYKPLKNKHFDKFLVKTRSRFGMVLTPMSHILRELISFRSKGTLTVSSFLSDQTPAKTDIHYWTRFLNQETAVYLGAEKIATKYNMAVAFFELRKVKRGYYSLRIEVLFEETRGLPEHVITDTHVKHLESLILEHPEYWVWSHRRWKHKREVTNA
ncbi:MAG: lysophospholipid acyltransferase family protein [Bacteroidales bacterium]